MTTKRILNREQILCAELSEGAARLQRFALRVEEGRAQDVQDITALAKAFKEILAGVDAKKALGVSGKQAQGRPVKTAAQADREELAPCIEVELLRLRERLAVPIAVDRVAREFDITPSTLEAYRKRHLKNAQWFAARVLSAERRHAIKGGR